MSTVYLHTLGFMQAVGFYTFKNISTSRTTSPAALAQHHKSVSSSKAFFWLLNAVKNRGLNAETCFLKHKKAKYAFVSLQVRSLIVTHYTCCLVILLFILLKRKFFGHILQNNQVTSNKMLHRKRHHFLAQFSIPFHMVCSVLLRVLASKTIE